VTLPFVTDDSVATTYAFNQLLDERPELVAEYESRNVKLLYALGFSENNIWSNDPIRTIEDLEGMRIRSVMSIANALSMLGAVPVSMAFGDAVGGLQRGVIDGFSSAPFLTSISVGLQDFAPYVSDGGGMGVYAVSSTSINLDRWNALTSEQQAIIDEVASEVPDHYASILSEMVDESVDKLKEAGTTEVVIMEEEEAARLREAVVGPLWNAWLEAAQGAGLDGQAFLDRYRELVVEQEAARDYVPGLTLYMDRYGG
jgi:TRAP-type transport system periplasmic protein